MPTRAPLSAAVSKVSFFHTSVPLSSRAVQKLLKSLFVAPSLLVVLKISFLHSLAEELVNQVQADLNVVEI